MDSRKQVLSPSAAAEYLGTSRSTVYRLGERDATFPRPVQLTERRVGFLTSELDEWIARKVSERDAKSQRPKLRAVV